jgi:hypothetical protein
MPFSASSLAAQLNRTMAVYRQLSRSSSSSSSSIDPDDEVLLHEPPTSTQAQRRIVLKEFFVRVFLLEDYDLPYTYRSLMPLVTVEVTETRHAKVTVSSEDANLLGHFIKWHRERMVPDIYPPRGFFSVLVIYPNKLEFEANPEDVKNIYEFFAKPVSVLRIEPMVDLVFITNLTEED